MTDLKRLTVSRTKHGAKKIADLILSVDPDKVVSSSEGVVSGVNLDPSQVRNILSALPGDILPDLWVTAKAAGVGTLNSLVMLAIIFSHHKIMKAFSDNCAHGLGSFSKAYFGNDKEFTNIRFDLHSLGYTANNWSDPFNFDLRPIVQDRGVGLLAAQLFTRKLERAKWDGVGHPVDECITNGFHAVLGLKELQFRRWVAGDSKNLDELPDRKDPSKTTSRPFVFKAGHREKKKGEVIRKGHGETASARLLHNELLNACVGYLETTYGKANIESECTGGPTQTSIDIVRRDGKDFVFYELKTSPSLRKCLREALPQLIEYSYWPDASRAKELVVVTTNGPTKDAEAYLLQLRSKFSLPIFHETINPDTGALSCRI